MGVRARLRSINRQVVYLRNQSPLALGGRVRQEFRVRIAPTYVKYARAATSASTDPRFRELPSLAEAYAPMMNRSSGAPEMLEGRFSFRGREYDFEGRANIRWENPWPEDESGEQWLHDLSFFGYASSLVELGDAGAEALASMLRLLEESTYPSFGRRPHFAWTPISLSLRIVGLLGAMGRGWSLVDPKFGRVVESHIQLCAAILLRTEETYLGYNHAVFCSVALSIYDAAVGASDSVRTGEVCRLIEKHLLADGYWVERSPTYHMHMMMMARCLLAVTEDEPTSQRLSSLICRMALAAGVTVHPDGQIAVLNDSAIGDGPSPAEVGVEVPASGLQVLPQAGYARLSSDEICAVFDAGPMGPDDVIGHAHADFLSVEVSVMGSRLIVDPGVASIKAGIARDWTRSAKSHNGPTVDGDEPADFFGAWRVGRRGSAWLNSVSDSHGEMRVSGSCDGYRRTVGEVRRSLTLTRRGVLSIEDWWQFPQGHGCFSRFIVPDSWSVCLVGSSEIECRELTSGARVRIEVLNGCKIKMVTSEHFSKGPMMGEAATMISIDAIDGRLSIAVKLMDA